jgi:serine/threonine protein kinase
MSERLVTGDWPSPPEMALAPPPTIPGFEIVDELGRGGMGVVYRARQVSLKRLVALKLIRDGALAGPEDRARFRGEAEAAARMRHPNFVQVYEVGEHQGQLYFAMELIDGVSLDKHLAGQSQTPGKAAELVRTLALAIHHAHSQKVVHRDLKPANILLRRDEGGGMRDEKQTGSSSSLVPHTSSLLPKITDFSLAKRLDSESTAWTQAGAVLGTASYMAPEQAAGRVDEIGPAVDVYALGAILYECLVGRPPFRADSWNEALQQVLRDEPVPPTRLNPKVPPDIETICLKCLEKDCGRRYASALELANDLGRFLEGKPVVALPLDKRERVTRLVARDGFQIVQEIGQGAGTTVYLAHYGPLKQPVALKVFRVGNCRQEEWATRLERSAQSQVALAHPHIVAVQQGGWRDGTPYLTMEYVPQGSLAVRLTGQPFPLKQALRLVEQLAEIVSYLHRQGVVHGNLKPSNVLMAADGIPRIADFRPASGLFQFQPPLDDGDSGGLGRLAPELVEANAEVRPYTDIYGLGIILYELLTGRPPFTGASAQETLEQVRSQEPVPPSQLNSDVPPELDTVCLRCLRKNPWRRYYRVYDLIRRLQSFA